MFKKIFRLSSCTFILFFILSGCNSFNPKPKILQVKEKTISVNGKQASFYAITQPDGTYGLTFNKGEIFNVVVENYLNLPTSVHWHGIILPNNQDGVAFITQFPIYPNETYSYHFPIIQSGTFWMHSHYGLQEQKLYTAPLILQDPEDQNIANQEFVLLLNDFTFTSAEKILENLHCQNKNQKASMNMDAAPMKMSADLADVNYDAFLINLQTIEKPEIILVQPNDRVRLRIINGSASTNFLLSLGTLEGEAIAVDGNRIQPLKGNEFELAIAQRIDVIVTIPQEGGAFPILAKGEGSSMQGGAILCANNAHIPSLSSKLSSNIDAFSYKQEKNLHAISPLTSRNPDQKIELVLGGNMVGYVWTINNQAWPEVTPVLVEKGQRVEITFKNVTSMSHPMHLHGHTFQVTAINGMPFQGALRDTVLVLPDSTLTIQFDANNPGVWPFHCHNLYHAESGMFTLLRYKE